MGLFDFRLLSFIGIKIPPKAPWKKYYDRKHMKIRLQDENIYDYLLKKINKYDYHDNIALTYFGTHIKYKDFIKKIDDVADKFLTMGVKKFDIVTILSANVPEAIIAFYALNKIGAVANMLHPLLSQNEIKNALNTYETKYLIALDITIKNVNAIIKQTKVERVIIISPANSMNIFMKIGYYFKSRDKQFKGHLDKNLYMKWSKFLRYRKHDIYYDKTPLKDEPALILQSGGSTGVPKGIVLSNGNINASTIAALNAYPDLCKEDRILGIMPIFHGFGLEVSINDALCVGAEIVIIPTFKADTFHELLIKHKPTVLVGVPTLFEALTKNEHMDDVDLSRLKYVIGGGDTLSKQRVEKINEFLHQHGARTNMIQGYGLTEAVAACCVDLRDLSHPGTIGIPWPGVYLGIFKPNTDERMPYGEDGEICVCGPTVMLGYYNNEAETNLTLRHHKDGNIWLHTGDIGSMDEDGFVTYKQRLKRMIVSSGYNVYPSQIEEVLESHDAVEAASVIGIPHPYKMEVPKAFIVLKKGYTFDDNLKNELIAHCKKNLAVYSVPKEYEVLDKLPKTLIGKVDFKKLKEDAVKEMRENNGKN
ncbi:MAG: AMP-binding protein [Bacilli bacterium]|nr:AMP-binding protein [Bacilli bacterium]